VSRLKSRHAPVPRCPGGLGVGTGPGPTASADRTSEAARDWRGLKEGLDLPSTSLRLVPSVPQTLVTTEDLAGLVHVLPHLLDQGLH